MEKDMIQMILNRGLKMKEAGQIKPLELESQTYLTMFKINMNKH